MTKLFCHYLSRVFLVLWVACAGLVVLLTLHVLAVSHWHGPFRDMWEIYPFLEKIIHHSWGLGDLWEAYGHSHRLLIPRLLYAADYYFSHASNHVLIAIALFCQVTICYLLGKVLCKQYSLTKSTRWILCCLLVIFQFSATLLFNFMHTFDVQWFLTCLFVAAAFYYLTVKNQGEIPRYLYSALGIVAACLCNFAGMAAWPIWFFLLFFQRRPGPDPRWMALPVLIFLVAYAAGIKSAFVVGEPYVAWLDRVIYLLIQFPLLYLSNPLADRDYLPFGSWMIVPTIAALFFVLRVFIRLMARQEKIDAGKLFFASLALFCLGVALMTGLGRGYDPSHVQALRYQNIVLLFWSASIPLVFLETQAWVWWKREMGRLPAWVVSVALLACQWQSWNENLLLGRNVSRAHLALMMGYSADVPLIAATVSRSMIYVPDYHLERERLLHQQSRTGIYHGALADAWLFGESRFHTLPDCQGVAWSLSPRITPYTRYIDFAISGELAGYDYGLLVNERGEVIAMALPDLATRLDVSLLRQLGLVPVAMRGLSRVEQLPAGALVLKSKESVAGTCRLPYNPGLK